MIFKAIAQKINKFVKLLSLINLYEFIKLRKIPRHVTTKTYFLDKEIKLVDACTFMEGIQEIFLDEIYGFRTANPEPTIIDCGANIGLSCIYFKQLHPKCKVIAFEPDPKIYKVLQQNVKSFALSNVELHNLAIWNSESALYFSQEGAFSGRIAKEGDDNLIEIKTTSLKNLLHNQKIDFLKIDIEGAEYEVIKDCKEELINVENLFIEYHSHFKEKQTLHEILEIIQNAGFRYHLKEAYTSSAPFITRPLMLNFDLQLNIFAFRI